MIPKILERTPREAFGCPSPQHDLGVEIELEGRNLQVDIPGWRIHAEGSLRGEGIEYVTAGTVNLKTLENSVSCLEKALTTETREVFRSHRTSTHIHLNFSSLPLIDALGYFTVFTIVEPVFLRICAPERDGNLFCLPTYDTGEVHVFIRRFLKTLVDVGGPPERGKYAAMNLNPLGNFGSVECRVFPSSLSSKQITSWAQWLLNIRSIAQEEKDKTYFTLINQSRTTPENLLGRVFNTPEPDDLWIPPAYPNSPSALVQFGCEQAYEISRELRSFFEKQIRREKKEGVPPNRIILQRGMPVSNELVLRLQQEGRVHQKRPNDRGQSQIIIDQWHYTYDIDAQMWNFN